MIEGSLIELRRTADELRSTTLNGESLASVASALEAKISDILNPAPAKEEAKAPAKKGK